MVRLTAPLGQMKFAFMQRQQRQKKGVYVIKTTTTSTMKILEESGRKVYNPLKFINRPPKPWVPPKEMYPDFRLERHKPAAEPNPTLTEDIYQISPKMSMSEGIEQACCLTNTQHFNGLPEPIQKLAREHSIKDQDYMVQRAIMQAVKWDPTFVKLPKRRDKDNLLWTFPREYGINETRTASLLLNSFLRLSMSKGGEFQRLTTDRIGLQKPQLDMVYHYKDTPIRLHGMSECMLHGRQFLPPLGDTDLVQASVDHDLFDMYPLTPLIDLDKKKTTVEQLQKCTGAIPKQYMNKALSYPQTMLRVTGNAYRHPAKTQAYNLLLAYGTAVAEARQRYGITSGQLDRPITILNINLTFQSFNFLCFQLNTLDIDNKDGIKNFVWTDSGNKLYDKITTQPWNEEHRHYKPIRFENYNDEVFNKFLGMCLYGYA